MVGMEVGLSAWLFFSLVFYSFWNLKSPQLTKINQTSLKSTCDWKIPQPECNKCDLAADSISVLVFTLVSPTWQTQRCDCFCVCASKVVAVFYPQHVLRPPSDQSCSAAAVKSVGHCWTPFFLSLCLSFSSSIPHLRTRTMSHLYVSQSHSFCMLVSVSFFFFPFPLFLLPTLSHHPIHTQRINRFVLIHPLLCHISITRQNGYGLLLRPQLAFIHFPEGSQGFSFFFSAAVGTTVNIWAG